MCDNSLQIGYNIFRVRRRRRGAWSVFCFGRCRVSDRKVCARFGLRGIWAAGMQRRVRSVGAFRKNGCTKGMYLQKG